MTLVPMFVLIGLFVLAEAFFAASEMALVQASRVGLQTRADEGDRGAEFALDLLAHEAQLLATCHIGINVSVVTASTLSVALADQAGAQPWAAMALVPVTLFFGQALPKTIGAHHADALAPLFAWPLQVLRSAIQPALLVIEGWSRLLKWAFRSQAEPDLTREELIDMLDDGEAGPIQEEERRLIRGVLSLSETSAVDCMTPLIKVVAVSETATVAGAAAIAIRTQHSRIPVYDKRIDRIVGVVHQGDLLFVRDDTEPISAHARPVHYVPEFKAADSLFREMRNTGEHFAVVVDEFGGCIGIVTLEDLLEELVGDIEDERATARPQVVEEDDGAWSMPGNTHVEQVEEVLDVELPEGPWLTIAGLLLARLDRIPEVGDAHEEPVPEGQVRVEVLEADDFAVRRVRVRRGAAQVAP
jgi:CBS domain containing-hemolysin-like protein